MSAVTKLATQFVQGSNVVMNGMMNEIRRLDDVVGKYKEDNLAKDTEISQLSYQVADLTQEVQTQKDTIAAHDETVEELTQSIQEKDTQIQELTGTNQELQGQVVILTEQGRKQKTGIDQQHQQLVAQAATIDTLNAQILELQRQLQAARADLQSTSEALNGSQVQQYANFLTQRPKQ